MELAGRNLLAVLSPSRGLLPYWGMRIDAANRARSDYYWPSHNIGRCWDAMLRLEAATGFAIPPDIEAAMLGHLKACFSNPLSVCGHLEEDRSAPRGWIDDHSQRESLMALACLVRYRGSDWAAEQGKRTVRALDTYIRADGTWDVPLMQAVARDGGVDVGEPPAPYGGNAGVGLTGTHGRMLEAVLEFYEATRDDAALKLADRLAEFHLDAATLADGTVPRASYTHTHSLFGTYRGLLKYGEMTGRQEYVERIAGTYAATVRRQVKQSGFISHDWGKDARGETTSPGDAAQLALRLARLGDAELFDDAERIVRCRILPSQITEPLGLQPLDDVRGDDGDRLDERALGAFGGMHQHPHGGKKPTTDITAADLHTLCEVYTDVVHDDGRHLRIDLHFEHENAAVCVESRRGDDACLSVRPKQTRTVRVRVPSWVPRGSVRLTVGSSPMALTWEGDYLGVGELRPGREAQVRYPLPVTVGRETTDGVEYELQWRGDEIAGIRPNTDVRPFYGDMA
jgi:hypothetical protein